MDIQTIMLIVTGVISGASLALKYIAPLTESKWDDKVQETLVKILKILSVDSNYDKDKVKLK